MQLCVRRNAVGVVLSYLYYYLLISFQITEQSVKKDTVYQDAQHSGLGQINTNKATLVQDGTNHEYIHTASHVLLALKPFGNIIKESGRRILR